MIEHPYYSMVCTNLTLTRVLYNADELTWDFIGQDTMKSVYLFFNFN